METILQVEHLNMKLKGFCIHDVNFSLHAGYIMGLIGRNGAGKTTIMKLIQNVLIKQSGSIKICGYDNRKHEIKAKNEIGFIVEHSPFIKSYTLLENAELFGKYYTNFNIEVFKSYLSLFKLDSSKNFITLSKGMNTRFQLSFALAHKPKLLILDEPTDGLDPVFRKEFINLLQELIADEKMAVLLSTHITSDLDKVADYITLIDKGEVIFSKDKETLLDQYLIVKGDKDLLGNIPKDIFISTRRFHNGFEGMIENEKDIRPYIKDKNHVILERAKLDDIMYFMSKRRKSLESAENF
jgi:ABC-2 type transport system ATP-binding protein